MPSPLYTFPSEDWPNCSVNSRVEGAFLSLSQLLSFFWFLAFFVVFVPKKCSAKA